MAEIDMYLAFANANDASDLHLKSGMRPRVRVDGNLEEVDHFDVLTVDDVKRLTNEITSSEQRGFFEDGNELDFTYECRGARFRCALFHDYRGPAAVFRSINCTVPTLEDLNLPPSIYQFAHARRGLILITGASGSGKSSTLAAIVDTINETYLKHIITLEDPIEYLHDDKLGVVPQRGMHEHFRSFQDGITSAMRQDPDVLVIGELRDIESMRRALAAAETGILVLTTLHTNSAMDSIDRMVDSFPFQEQDHARVQLSESLCGIVSQVLINRSDRSGRVPATEILFSSPAIASIIREGKTSDILNVIQGGKDRGMHTMDESLLTLVDKGLIDVDDARAYARSKRRFTHEGQRSPTLRYRD